LTLEFTSWWTCNFIIPLLNKLILEIYFTSMKPSPTSLIIDLLQLIYLKYPMPLLFKGEERLWKLLLNLSLLFTSKIQKTTFSF
jgi:hypothetical protein